MHKATPLFAFLTVFCATGLAQQPKQYTSQDYAAAEKFMAYGVNHLAYQGQVKAQALDDGRFWYRAVDDSGITYTLVDPARGTRGPMFDQQKLAAAVEGRFERRH